VRDALRLSLAERIAGTGAGDEAIAEAIRDAIAPRVTFVDHSLVFDGVFYLEHGHRFDKFSHVLKGPTLPGGEELNLPFGSFFNRYLINKIELDLPFVDNVRPRENLLPLLVRERFPLAVRLLFKHLPLMVKLIPKFYVWYMLRNVVITFLAIATPIAIVVAFEWKEIQIAIGAASAVSQNTAVDWIARVLRDAGAFVLSYVFARLVAYFQLVEPDSLAAEARRVFREKREYKLITFGHTHDPDQTEAKGRWFFNTGTWIPIIETSSAAIRHDRTYTFLHVDRDGEGAFLGRLLRWNDDAGRPEPALVFHAPAGDG
jgi:hypothetical protein